MKKYHYLYALLAIIILGFSFYWFELRVAQIRKNCVEKIMAPNEIKGLQASDYNVVLKLCLYKYGIKE